MTAPVRLGLLGCADIARRRMLPAMAASPDVSVAAVASRDAAKAEEFAAEFGCRPVHGYDRLLARDDIDAVYVPLPSGLHAHWVREALTAGKHVLAEKPLTTDPEQTRSLFDLAGRRGLALMENVMFVHHDQHRAVARLLAEGAIGDLRGVRAVFTIPRRPEGDIRYDPALGGGAVLDLGVYVVRAAMYFLGRDLTVAGAALRHEEVDVGGAALLRRGDGLTAQLTFGLDDSYESSYELRGSTGRITVERAFTPPADFVPAVRLDGAAVPLPCRDQVAATVAAFAAAVRAGGAPPEDSLRQAEILAGILGFAGRPGGAPGAAGDGAAVLADSREG